MKKNDYIKVLEELKLIEDSIANENLELEEKCNFIEINYYSNRKIKK